MPKCMVKFEGLPRNIVHWPMTMQTCVIANKLRCFCVKKLLVAGEQKRRWMFGDAFKQVMKFLVCFTRICIISCSHTVDGSEIRRSPVDVSSLSYLQGFLHSSWCRICSINSVAILQTPHIEEIKFLAQRHWHSQPDISPCYVCHVCKWWMFQKTMLKL